MDRSIPHIRNIFSSSSRKKSTSDTQDLCQYEKSPRNRKKSSKDQTTSSSKKTFDFGGKENVKTNDEHRKTSNSKTNDEHRKTSNRSNGNYNTYTSKTLTEKDMKHLERHLSMKKTIRKQISRNLAQAFLDNPNIFEPEADKPVVANHQKPEAVVLPQQDIAKTEQNVLDLLKISIDDRDSGHSSPTPETLEDTDYDEDAEEIGNWRSSSKHRNSDTKGLMEDRSSKYGQEPEKKSSIWKMFSPRNKGKR